MANIDFPPGAINGTTYSQNGKTWVFDGTSWSIVANIIPDASTTTSGLVNTSTQVFGGDKNFANNLDVVGGLGVTGSVVLRSTVDARGILSVNNNTNSTSSTTGAAVVVGGLGVSGNLNVGTGLTVFGQIHSVLNNNSTSSTTGAVVITGGLGVSGRIFGGTGLSVSGATTVNSTITVNGASILNSTLYVNGTTVIQSGGLGVTGQSVFRNNVEIQSGGLGVTGQSVFRNNIEIQSGGLGVTGLVIAGTGLSVNNGITVTGTINSDGISIRSSGLGVTGQSVFRNNVEIQSGGLGVTGLVVAGSGLSVNNGVTITGQSVFKNNVEIQSGGLGVTGVVIAGSGLSANNGVTITGQSVFKNNVEIQSGGLGVTGLVTAGTGLSVNNGTTITGQSVFKNNIEVQSGGLGVTGLVIAGSGLSVNNGATITGQSVFRNNLSIISGGLGVTGQSVFRNNLEIQSGGLGVTGSIAAAGGIAIYSGGLGVTGAAVFNSSISAGSLSLTTPLPLSSGGTGLGSTSLANYILGMNSSSLGLEYKQIVEGSNITVTHGANSITIAATSASATPGGPNNAIQYNGSGTLAGTSTFLWDNPSQRIDIRNISAIGTGTTTGFILQNSTASTAGVQLQFSPGLEMIGRAWKTSGSPATDTLVRYHQMVEVTSGATPTGAVTWKSAIHNAANQGPTYVKRAEINTNFGLGIYDTNGVYKSSIINSASATTDIYYTLPASLPSLNQALTVSGISVSSVTLSWVSNGTVASGASGALAYYAGTGTTVDDATGLAYASSGTHLVVTSQTATDVPLRVDGHASSSVNLFQVRKGTNSQVLINSSGELIFSSSMRGGTNSFSKTLGAGDIGLDNGTVDSPAVLFYLENNKNFGIDAFAGSGVTRFRIVKELNESGGTELWSIDQRGVVYRSGYAVGETIKTQTYNYSDLGMSGGGDPVSVTSATYQTIATASYTPVSSSSYLWIEFSATYDYNNGSTADEFAANIEVGGSEIVNVFQKFVNASGGGTRSGVLFPLAGRYTNSATSALTITVRVKRNSGDDPVRVYGNAGSGYMRIQEIGR